MDIVADLIEAFDPDNPNFRPTGIYNENWLLKAFLHQASEAEFRNSPFTFANGSTWFSEASLPTAFRARYRGDHLAETRTYADGVIGHILIGKKGKADLELQPDAHQFVVIEAKINSPLSPGTSNAPDFDQAARNVACMAEVLRRADIAPREVELLSFVVLAPHSAIDAGTFSREMDLAGMKRKIQDRVATYDGDLDPWYQKWAEPTLEAVDLLLVSWEYTIRNLEDMKPEAGRSLEKFYGLCLEFN